MSAATVLIVPGLRDHVADHWQTHLAARLPRVVTVPPLVRDKLDLAARTRATAGATAPASASLAPVTPATDT